MDKLPHVARRSEAEAPTDLLAGLLMERTSAQSLRAKVLTVMAVTTALTFATLVTAYQLLFSHQLFA